MAMNTEPSTSPQKAPDYTYYRLVAAADGAVPPTNKKLGMNMAGYEFAHIQIIPTLASGANPTALVYWWAEKAGTLEAGQFVREHTAISKTGVGANAPYEFTVECKGRVMFVALNPMAAGTAKIFVSGFNRLHPH